MGLKNYFHYWRNYVTSGSGIAGCDCTVFRFLDASSHIYKWVCLCPSIHGSIPHAEKPPRGAFNGQYWFLFLDTVLNLLIFFCFNWNFTLE